MSAEIKFLTRAFSVEAIKNAAYDYGAKVVIDFLKITESEVVLSLKSHHGDAVDKRLVDTFKTHVLDHQVRLDVLSDTNKIREMIVAQAFAPCENIEDIIEIIKP